MNQKRHHLNSPWVNCRSQSPNTVSESHRTSSLIPRAAVSQYLDITTAEKAALAQKGELHLLFVRLHQPPDGQLKTKLKCVRTVAYRRPNLSGAAPLVCRT